MSTTQQLVTPTNVEDVLLATLPVLAGPTGTALINLTGMIPGVSGFVLAVIIASLAKSSIGLSQNRKSYEDWLTFLITFAGLLAAGFAGSDQNTIAEAGLILGFIAKALPSMAQGINIEDLLLFVGSLVAAIGAAGSSFGLSATTAGGVANLGLLTAAIGKSWPSLASSGRSGQPSTPATSPMPPGA